MISSIHSDARHTPPHTIICTPQKNNVLCIYYFDFGCGITSYSRMRVRPIGFCACVWGSITHVEHRKQSRGTDTYVTILAGLLNLCWTREYFRRVSKTANGFLHTLHCQQLYLESRSLCARVPFGFAVIRIIHAGNHNTNLGIGTHTHRTEPNKQNRTTATSEFLFACFFFVPLSRVWLLRLTVL